MYDIDLLHNETYDFILCFGHKLVYIPNHIDHFGQNLA